MFPNDVSPATKVKTRSLIKTQFLLLAACITTNFQATAGTPEGVWATVFGGKNDEYFNDLCVNREGIIYAVGAFDHGSANGDPYTNGIVKFDSAGNRAGGLPMLAVPGQPNVHLIPSSICFDSDGNFAVLGNSYLAKYNTKDELLWRKDFPSDLGWYGGLAVDRDNSIIFVGALKGPGKIDHVTFGEGGGPIVAKVAGDGTLRWARRIQESGVQSGAKGVDLDRAGNIFVTGFLSGGETDFGGQVLYPNWLDRFIAKYTTNGDLIWVRTGYGSHGIAVDSRGDCYFAGSNLDQMQFGKMSADGDLIWVHDFYEGSYNPWLEDVTLDGAGYPIFTGQFSRKVNFGGIALTSKGNSKENIFVLRMNPAGEVVWAISGGGTGFSAGTCVTVDRDGEIYAGGVINSPSGSILGWPLKVTRTDGSEAFLARIHDNGVANGPLLTISADQNGGALISWPAGQNRFLLERTSSLSAEKAWTEVLEEPLIVGDRNVLSVNPEKPASYYRLHTLN